MDTFYRKKRLYRSTVDLKYILISSVEHTASDFFRLNSIESYYKLMDIIPCAIQYILVSYLFFT